MVGIVSALFEPSRSCCVPALWFATALCLLFDSPQAPAQPSTVAGQDPYFLLEQGWTNEQREQFWSLGQGAEIIPVDWFNVLEQADSQEKFAAPKNIAALGYIPRVAPDEGLPIGFTRARNPHTGAEWLGINCAACHTNTITFDGTTLLIDGAPARADYWQFNKDLVAALSATLTIEAKFERFLNALHPEGANATESNRLRDRLAAITQKRLAYNERNAHEIEYGFGRLDALGFIFNEVTVGLLKAKDGKTALPENRRSPEAPVSYPFLWGTSQADYVQWNGVSFAQLPLGNLARDVVEVLGVYGNVDLDCQGNFKSSILFRNSLQLANLVETLRAPQWPNNIFPPVNPELASVGEGLYREHCVDCHEVIPREDWDRRYRSQLWPMSVIGTDAKYARNAVQWVKSGCLEGEAIMPGGGETLGAYDMSYSIASHVALKVMAQEPGEAILPVLGFKGFMENLQLNGLELRKPGAYYKARPLNGIWATAPYLHNGSVPTLDDLLKPPSERPKRFRVGCTEFDPVKVGFVDACEEGGEFRAEPPKPQIKPAKPLPDCGATNPDPGRRADTGEWLHYPFRDPRFPDTDGGPYPEVRDTGNCNIGHDIRHVSGKPFSSTERAAMVEYLKTL